MVEESAEYSATDRTKLNRLKNRGSYDKATAHAILDEAFVAHVGFIKDGYPLVLPMGYARDGEYLLLHGSITNAMMKTIKVSISGRYTQPKYSRSLPKLPQSFKCSFSDFCAKYVCQIRYKSGSTCP